MSSSPIRRAGAGARDVTAIPSTFVGGMDGYRTMVKPHYYVDLAQKGVTDMCPFSNPQ
jgi:hypothetical protein